MINLHESNKILKYLYLFFIKSVRTFKCSKNSIFYKKIKIICAFINLRQNILKKLPCKHNPTSANIRIGSINIRKMRAGRSRYFRWQDTQKYTRPPNLRISEISLDTPCNTLSACLFAKNALNFPCLRCHPELPPKSSFKICAKSAHSAGPIPFSRALARKHLRSPVSLYMHAYIRLSPSYYVMHSARARWFAISRRSRASANSRANSHFDEIARGAYVYIYIRILIVHTRTARKGNKKRRRAIDAVVCAPRISGYIREWQRPPYAR